jgi:hypothetical protein
MWWMKQGELARKEIYEAHDELVEVLIDFAKWLPDGSKVWGNGSDFDNVILAAAYAKVGIDCPWQFWNNRCFRTLKSICPIKHEFKGTAHNALDDAHNQAEHLILIMDALKRGV